MKTTIQTLAAATIVTLSTNASAVSFGCDLFGQMAANIMEQHQLSVPLSDVMRPLNQGALNESDAEEVKALALEAYASPRHSDRAMRKRAIADFRDAQTLKCHRAK